MLQRTNAETKECYNERMLQRKNATTNECYDERMLHRMNATRKECCNERMLQRTVFINKIRMLQRTQMIQRKRTNTMGRRSTRVCMTCQAFPLWLECQSSSFLSFIRFSYQFISVIFLFAPLAIKIYFFKLFYYIILAMSRQNRVRKLINLDIKKEIISKRDVGLEMHIYFNVFRRTNNAITNEVIEPITFVLAYPTVL
jgi:hypothetical protein